MIRGARNVLAVLFLGLISQGCSPACDTSDESNAPVVYAGGSVANGWYTSSSSHGELLHFPGGQRYDLVHHLGFEPSLVQLYWSFSEAGIGSSAQSSDKSTLTLASGNSALVQLKNDQFIRVKNDSCAEFWLLVVAAGSPVPSEDGGSAGDASSPFAQVLPSE